ncbi:uncharacterized protein KY384_005124 [Bacidia gigantensis]|uniref:uncharacterized protein n=1 Tax=Bacidia gigantensis TaxID=2732470 RepID=UPI001D05B989|nr:uncharacterized protein KY384_005124 [Bacidia gigantensis]KAG8529643.1 hypothetical protein KY384_005124 [Bacidia gigantensis]
MSQNTFQVLEHVIPCQYVREYPNAIKYKNAQLRLAIKEYKPLGIAKFSPNAVTIIAAHANGFPKECYEPLFEDLLRSSRGRIRSIWIADASHQGASGVLNEDIQGDERLALIEPVIQPHPPRNPSATLPTSYRQDLWPSRAVAQAAFRKNKFFKIWDPRALDQYVSYGLRETPTALYPAPVFNGGENPQSPERPVTLTTTKHQEAWTYVHSNFISVLDPDKARKVAPNLSAEDAEYFIHNPNMIVTYNNLPHVRPNVFWMFGKTSQINYDASMRDEKVARTGTGVGGNGGTQRGRVEKKVFECGHMLPFEKIDECASALASWLEKQIHDFEATEEFWKTFDSRRSERDRLAVSKTWLDIVKMDVLTKRADKPKL